MPRNFRDAGMFLLGLWLSIALLEPLMTPSAWAEDPFAARLESELFHAVNAFRQSERLITFERRPDLDAVARAHSEDMVRRGYFSHETPEGFNWVDRMLGADIRGFTLAGENVGQTNQRDPGNAILDGWKASPDHRRNLTASAFNATGIGIARSPDGRMFFTQLYATFPRTSER